MKQLTQATFDGMSENVVSAAINSGGDLLVFNCQKQFITTLSDTHQGVIGSTFFVIDFDYDATNWQNSAIDREVAK